MPRSPGGPGGGGYVSSLVGGSAGPPPSAVGMTGSPQLHHHSINFFAPSTEHSGKILMIIFLWSLVGQKESLEMPENGDFPLSFEFFP